MMILLAIFLGMVQHLANILFLKFGFSLVSNTLENILFHIIVRDAFTKLINCAGLFDLKYIASIVKAEGTTPIMMVMSRSFNLCVYWETAHISNFP